ncbi:family 65 glycosyl hydrolase [Escherichia coli]|nr:family 65 glycosyl hydrolase [Escherichia coli]CTR13151.1 glycosyl hydrolase [Escherichia coli]CTR20785.1 glycosyl hydrolase [Escherichia coli]CTT81164.1 glycosyl hydrolase [Escherichia coli]CTU59695.1 glycosyl hydrolase [Escherichia coli]
MKSAMTSSPLRVAIIGAGQVADKVHASYYCTRNDLELVAVCDSRLSQAQALAEKYGNASVWDDPQAMLLAVKPDVVSVCSPNRFHYEHTLMALEAGCHVMCEKPPAMTPEQAREMCDTARKLGKVLAYDFHHRFALDTQQLREQVTNGVLGEIYVTTARALRRCGVPGWRTSNGSGYTIASRRFVSADQLPLIALEITITPLDADASVLISTGIDATQTNHGRQHLDETQVRVFGQHLMQGSYTTQDGRSDVAISCCCKVSGDVQQCYTAKERRLLQHTSAQLHAGETMTLQKLVWIDWRDDRQAALDEWGSASLRQLEMCAQQSYDQLLAASTENWRQWWQKRRITVNGGEAHDQQALDYALYHLRIMTPAHDERSSIAAKGLTGEGYKGHVFWDTEVFLLPFHLFSDPTVARSLLRYRWHNLPGAQEKARRNGWQGALFPWESARSGEEETPEFAAINIRTGLRQKVASAQAEHHLVADIAWAVIQYWQTTGDESFIAHEGMALLLETAKFWISRAVRVNDRLEIHDVIGPDEYTEHVNNNAYTSYMARYNVQQALNIARQFGCSDDAFIHRAEMFLKELWMPEIQPDGVLPQDDSFMAKPAINLAKYKAAAGKQTILLDYSRAEVNEMQILKQADVVMLNYMLPEQFSAASCLANLQFYEPRTIHDSSLSKAIHGIVAARCGLLTQSYQFWREGTEIDLGADPHSCDDGIHAAATGAIWLGAIQGFAGVSVRDGELHLNPALPEQWQQLSFPLFWQGCELQVTLDAQRIAIRTSAPVSLRLNGQLITVAEESVFCLGDFILPFNGTATKHQEDE